MHCNDLGHNYTLAHFEGCGNEQLQFVKKEKNNEGRFVTVVHGTTNEEVLRVLIDRMYYLQSKASCRENSIVITKLEEALMWLEKRTQDRILRGVEGTSAK